MLLMDGEVTSGSELALPPFVFYLVSYLLRVNDIALYKVVMEIVCKNVPLNIRPDCSKLYLCQSNDVEGDSRFLTRCIHRLAPRAMPKAN